MTTLEERIAEAIKQAQRGWRGGSDHEFFHSQARAVVAVLPTADVSDEAILDAIWAIDPPSAVRALLNAQAAAHAAEVEALRAEVTNLRGLLRNAPSETLVGEDGEANQEESCRTSDTPTTPSAVPHNSGSSTTATVGGSSTATQDGPPTSGPTAGTAPSPQPNGESDSGASDYAYSMLAVERDELSDRLMAAEAEVEALRGELIRSADTLVHDALQARAESAEADRDANQDVIDAVRALAEATGMDPRVFVHAGMRAVLQTSIRAALDDA
jgi:hypothetical protein